MAQSLWKNNMAVPQTLKNRIINYHTIQKFHFWIYPQKIQSRVLERYLHTHVHSSTVHNSQEMEATQVSIDRWVNKQSVAQTYNGILFTLKRKEILTQSTTWINIISVKQATHRKTNIWCDSTYMRFPCIPWLHWISRGVWASLVVALGLSCPSDVGIFAPLPGMEPLPPALEGGFLTTGPPGKPL